MNQVLIFANGDVLDGPMVRRSLAAASNPHVIAADGGARIAWYFNMLVGTVIGDMDSLSPQELNSLVESGTVVMQHPSEKDFTDLELALNYAAEELDAQWIRVIGGVGDRIDQTLANIYLLALPSLVNRDVSMVAGKQEIRLLSPGEHPISGQQGDTISLIPVGGAVSGIRTENLHYPLRDEILDFGPARGISNVMNEENACVTIQQGRLLLVHTVGRA